MKGPIRWAGYKMYDWAWEHEGRAIRWDNDEESPQETEYRVPWLARLWVRHTINHVERAYKYGRRLSCGCTRWPLRIALIRADCEKHFGRYFGDV